MKLITQNGQLELPKDFSLNMERTNPLLSGEGDASIPATLPSSSRNLAALGHRERIDRANRYTNKVDAILQVGPVQKRGQLVIDTMHRREGIDASFAIDNSDLYVKAKEKSLKAIFAEGDNGNDYKETFGNISTAMTRMQDIYAAGTDTYDYTIFPVSIAPYEENNIKHYQYNNEVDGGGNLVYEARTVREGDVNMSVPAGYGIAPFLKLHRLLVRLFECLGYTVSYNCFAANAYKNIVIVHNCTDCLCNPTVTLYYKDMVPSCTLSEFLDWMLAKFHAQPVVNSETKEVKIVLMESVLADRADIDITSKVEGDFTVQLNPTKRIVLTPTNSLEGTEPAADSFEELVEKYGGYVEADEDQWDSLTGNEPAYNDCLVLRMTTGEFAALNYNIQTGLQAVEVIGTNHFTYDRHNSDDTEAFSQADVMPLMRVDPATKRGVSPFVGERLHYHTSYKGQKEDDKQEVIVVQRAYNDRFIFKTTGTTQKFIPYGTYGFGSGETLGFGLTNFELYEPFWGFYNTLLLNHATHLKCRVAYDLGQFLGLDMSRPKFCNGQKLLPVSASAVLGDRFGLTDAEFLLVKKFGDGVKDEGIEPMGGNGLKWSVSNDAEEIVQDLFDALKPSLNPGDISNLEDWDADIVSYSISYSSEAPNPGMPTYLGQTITIQALVNIMINYEVKLMFFGGETSTQPGSASYQNQTVTFTFTAIQA
jgi:hypothetical protein